jgi:hypothetical protein
MVARAISPVQPWYLWITALVVLGAAAILYAMGQPLWCTCGYVKFWHGEVMSSENSQHLSDWYSFTHPTHGILFYLALWLVAPRAPLGLKLALATGMEAAWEVLENTDFVINRYREATISLNYFGDSVVNSIGDMAFMILGFLAAASLPAWATVALVAGTEIGLAYAIRDNLILNILMLFLPLESLKNWQLGV